MRTTTRRLWVMVVALAALCSDLAAATPGACARQRALPNQDLLWACVTEDDGWTDVGSGTIDWKGIWPSIAHSGCDLLVLENDNPSDWRGFAAHSHSFLSGLAGNKKG